jgi:hypothetical protein
LEKLEKVKFCVTGVPTGTLPKAIEAGANIIGGAKPVPFSATLALYTGFAPCPV